MCELCTTGSGPCVYVAGAIRACFAADANSCPAGTIACNTVAPPPSPPTMPQPPILPRPVSPSSPLEPPQPPSPPTIFGGDGQCEQCTSGSGPCVYVAGSIRACFAADGGACPAGTIACNTVGPPPPFPSLPPTSSLPPPSPPPPPLLPPPLMSPPSLPTPFSASQVPPSLPPKGFVSAASPVQPPPACPPKQLAASPPPVPPVEPSASGAPPTALESESLVASEEGDGDSSTLLIAVAVLLPIGLGALVGVFVCLWCRVLRARKAMGSLLDADRRPKVTLLGGESEEDGLDAADVVATGRVAPSKLPKDVVEIAEPDADQSPARIVLAKDSELGEAVLPLQSNGCLESAKESVGEVELEGDDAEAATHTNVQSSGRSKQLRRGTERDWRSFAMSESEAASIGALSGLADRRPSVQGVALPVDVGDMTLAPAATEASPRSNGEKLGASPKLSAATNVLLKRMAGGSDAEQLSLPPALLTRDGPAPTAGSEEMPTTNLDAASQLAKLQTSFRGVDDDDSSAPVSNHADSLATTEAPTPASGSKATAPGPRKGSAKDLIARFNSQEFNSDKKREETIQHSRTEVPPKPRSGAGFKLPPKPVEERVAATEAPGTALNDTAESPNGAVTTAREVSFTSQNQPFAGRGVPAALLRARSANEVKRSAIDWLQQTSEKHMQEDDSGDDYTESNPSAPTSPTGPDKPFGADAREKKQMRRTRSLGV